MNILHISPQVPYPPNDGGKLSIFGLLKSLSKRGHHIHFVCYRKHADYQKSYNELSKYSVPHIIDVQTDNSVSGILTNMFSPVPYNISKYIRKEMKSEVQKIVIENEIDVVLINNTHLAWIIDHIKNIRDIPCILRLENVEMMIMKRYSETQQNPFLKFYSWLQYLKFLRYEPAVCEKADMCAAITEVDGERLKSMNSNINITAVPSGIDEDLLRVEQRDKEPYSIFHIGAMEWLPNRDSVKWFLESILPRLIMVNDKIKLYIYGKGTDEINVPPVVEKNVVLKGFVKDLWEEVSDKALAVIPLRVGSGMRIKILELLAQGHLIISTSIGSEGIDVIENEHYIQADKEDEFVEKITAFFEGKYEENRISESAKKLIEQKYVWSAIVARFEDVFNKLRN